MNKEIHVKDILKYLNDNNEAYIFEGNDNVSTKGFSSYGNYRHGSLTWLKNISAIEQNGKHNVTLAVVQEGLEESVAENRIITKESKRVFFDLLENFFSTDKKQESVGRNTYISPEVKLGKNVIIGNNCTLDGDITIGDGTRIYNNVNIINSATIGKDCEIQSGVNIGHNGFAFTEDEAHKKTMVKHYGNVIIGNDVYIGGNCYIERGTIDSTIIKNGAKIDGACIIGHNCNIGRNVAMVAGTILFGSVCLEDNAYIASALVKNQVTVGRNAIVGMGSVVTKNVEVDTTVIGVPARELNNRNYE